MRHSHVSIRHSHVSIRHSHVSIRHSHVFIRHSQAREVVLKSVDGSTAGYCRHLV